MQLRLPIHVTDVQKYKRCPKMFAAEVEKRYRQPEGHLSHLGVLVHSVIAEYLRWCRANGQQTDYDRLPVILNDKHRESGMAPETWDEAYEICDTFARSHLVPQGHVMIEGTIKVDREGRLVHDDSPLGWLEGTPDFVDYERDDRVTIVDWKSGYASEPDWFQLETYAWLVAETISMTARPAEYELVYDYVRWNVVKSKIVTADDLPRIEKRLRRITDLMEKDTEWKATPGTGCSFCTEECSVEVRPYVCRIEDEAVEMARALILAEKEKKRIEGYLKPYIAEHGNVTVNGIEVGYKRSGDLVWPDVDTFKRACLDAGVNPVEYLKVDTRQVNKELRDNGELPGWLVAIGESGATLRFGTRKAKGG